MNNPERTAEQRVKDVYHDARIEWGNDGERACVIAGTNRLLGSSWLPPEVELAWQNAADNMEANRER